MSNTRQWDGWKMLGEISTPTIWIISEGDRMFPRRVFECVGEASPGAEIVDGGASKHKVQLERHAAVNCAIERFIVEGDRRFTSRDQAVKSGPVDEPLEMCCRRLEPYPAPWEIESKQDLTKSFVGKVLRRVLVEDRA